MFITQNIAQRIVDQIGDIIDQHVNFMSDNAIIIASTDKGRIGDFHEGSKIVMETQKVHNILSDDQYQGSRHGINIPILFDDKIVGVLGITGEVNEVIKYGRIVKQMTEILIKEQYSQDLKRLERRKSELIIQEILFSAENYEQEGFNSFLGIDFNQRFRAIVVKLDTDGNADYQFYINDIFEQTFDLKSKPTFSYFRNGNLYILTNLINKSEVKKKLEILTSKINQQTNLLPIIGVGNISSSIKTANHSFTQAEKVIEWDIRNNTQTFFYDKMDLGIIITDLDSKVQSYLVEKILSKIPENEKDKYKKIINVYEKHNKSIKSCAEELFIHKNTFQYQLKKIYEYTGYNPTNLKDFVILKLVFSLI